MKRTALILLFAIILVSVISCTNILPDKGKNLLAKVGDKSLYLEDIPQEKFVKTIEGDSATRLRRYVEKWVEDQFFLLQAKQEVSEQSPLISEILEEYKRNLMIYELEKLWMNNFTDTTIGDSAINAYYEANKENFQLRKNIVKIRYVKVEKDIAAKELAKVKNLIKNPSQQNDSLIRIFAEQKAENFYLDNNWLYFDDVLIEIPISSNYNQERFLQNNRFVELTEGRFIYLVNFVDLKIKDDITPLEFERDNIKKYIIMQRKAQYIEKKRRELLNQAIKSGEIKTWIN
ncbi:MAG: hypothetical protein M0R38_05425 [Bacteroidia bacterium]|nr:hypothetical protein [Bacteroidia bacterium]